jgi:CheY-like chemotaxis protein
MNRTHSSLLVVDDDAVNRDLLSRRLGKEGYTVAAAESGTAALAMLEFEAYDLVLLDIMMPDIDGIDVLREIRSRPTTRDMPVMMVSAMNDRENVIKCIEHGANDFISKPFDMLLIKSRVWRCLERGSFCELRSNPMQDTPPGTVLIAEDNAMNLDLLSRRVERQGHRPLAAADGCQALKLMREHDVDLVLLDINMPCMDGITALQRMKADAGLQHIPVIMVSASADPDMIHCCLELGADDYIAKPFNATLLNSRMGPLISIKKKADTERSQRAHLQQLAELGETIR